MQNPLLDKNELPPFGSIKAEHVVPAIKKLIDDGRDEIDALLDAGKNNWHELVEVVEEAKNTRRSSDHREVFRRGEVYCRSSSGCRLADHPLSSHTEDHPL